MKNGRKALVALVMVAFVGVAWVARNTAPPPPPREEAETALIQAVREGNLAQASAMLAAYPEMAKSPVEGQQPLVKAVMLGVSTPDPQGARAGIVAALLERGADPNQPGKHGQTLLGLATRSLAGEPIARLLVKHGADTTDALQQAVSTHQAGLVADLLAKGVRPSPGDATLELAKHDPAIRKLLEEHGTGAAAAQETAVFAPVPQATPLVRTATQESEVPSRTRVFEQGKVLKVKPVVPWPTDLPPSLAASVERLLTFDPGESQGTWRARLKTDLALIMASQRLDALDLVVMTYRRKQLVSYDGFLILSDLQDALEKAGAGRKVRDAYVVLLEAWVKETPSSATAHWLLGKEWVNWAREVEEKRAERFQRGWAELQAAARLDPDPEIYADLLLASLGLGHPPSEQRKLLEQAWQAAPGLFWHAPEYYSSHVEGRELTKFLEEFTARTRSTRGEFFFSLLVAPHFDHLKPGPLWPRVQQGLLDQLKRFPRTGIGEFRRAAVWAHDKEAEATVIQGALDGRYELNITPERRAGLEEDLRKLKR